MLSIDNTRFKTWIYVYRLWKEHKGVKPHVVSLFIDQSCANVFHGTHSVCKTVQKNSHQRMEHTLWIEHTYGHPTDMTYLHKPGDRTHRREKKPCNNEITEIEHKCDIQRSAPQSRWYYLTLKTTFSRYRRFMTVYVKCARFTEVMFSFKRQSCTLTMKSCFSKLLRELY